MCPLLPFLAHACAPAGTGTGVPRPSPGSSGGHKVAVCHRQSHGQQQEAEPCLAVRRGACGKESAQEHSRSMCAVELAGVCV